MKLRVLMLAALAVIPAGVEAGPRDDVVDVLVKCTDVTDRDGRLDCYDRLAPQLRAAARTPPGTQTTTQTGEQTSSVQSNAPPSQQIVPPPSQQATTAPPEGSFFDFSNAFEGDPDESGPTAQQMAYQPIGQEILPVSIGVADYAVAPSGAFTVTLDNGQVWREHSGNFETPPFSPDRKNIVVIKHGLFGTHNLYLKGYYGKLYKVVRVK